MILEPKPKKMLKLYRIRDKTCKKQKWREVINQYAWNRSASWSVNVRPTLGTRGFFSRVRPKAEDTSGEAVSEPETAHEKPLASTVREKK